MLFRRINTGSQPFGLARAGEDIIKGSAVVVKYTGVGDNGYEAFYPANEAEANSVKGFATYRIEEEGKADKDFEVIKKGSWIVIYTLVKDNMWGTTQFVDGVAGDKLVVGFTADDKGKVRKLTAGEVSASRKPQFEMSAKFDAGVGYTDASVDVMVL